MPYTALLLGDELQLSIRSGRGGPLEPALLRRSKILDAYAGPDAMQGHAGHQVWTDGVGIPQGRAKCNGVLSLRGSSAILEGYLFVFYDLAVEARVRIELTHKGFADLSLTTWVPRPKSNDEWRLANDQRP